MKNNFLIKLQLKVEFLLLIFLYLSLSKLPFFIVSNLGGFILRFLGPKTKIQKIVKKNFLQVFPNAKLNFLTNESKKNCFPLDRDLIFEVLGLGGCIWSTFGALLPDLGAMLGHLGAALLLPVRIALFLSLVSLPFSSLFSISLSCLKLDLNRQCYCVLHSRVCFQTYRESRSGCLAPCLI